jgi:hypothetical protein
MLVGALLPCHGTGGDPDTLREYAQALESGGYDFLEAPDHVDRGSQLSRFSGRHSVSRNDAAVPAMKVWAASSSAAADNAASGDAMTNDWDSFGLMLHHCRHGRAAPLAHHHDATALAALVLASTPINASEPIIF